MADAVLAFLAIVKLLSTFASWPTFTVIVDRLLLTHDGVAALGKESPGLL
jgi:hypothetical protein